jgi:hypothetical protein
MSEESEASSPRREGGNGSTLGTRFLIYPQAPYVPGYATPEPVWVSTPPDRLLTGPQDQRMYVRDPLLEKDPYEYPYLPPFVGDVFPQAQAGPDGHFDHLLPGSREFISAHAFASVRRVLDIWESYLGHQITWHFADTYERLEIIPWLDWSNAQSGYGFLELGTHRAADGKQYPYALNFDVIAHEIGHSILFSLFGTPENGLAEGDFFPLHEACADLVSLLSFLHFDSGIDRLLRHCDGNLLVLNELNRIAELTDDQQIRLAGNARRLSEVTSEVHDQSRPFTGAIFDTIVDLFHAQLVAQGRADERLLGVDIRNVDSDLLEQITAFTASTFRARPFLFKTALVEARDAVAIALARTWPRLIPNDLTFGNVALAVIEAAHESDPRLVPMFEENFRWREII